LPDGCRIQSKVEKKDTLFYYALSQLSQPVSDPGGFCAETEYEVRTYKNFIRNGVANMTHITQRNLAHRAAGRNSNNRINTTINR